MDPAVGASDGMSEEESMGLPDFEREVALYGGVAVGLRHAPHPDVIEVLRQAVEEVVVPAIGIDLTWFTVAIRSDDDLESGDTRTTGRDGVDLDFALSRVEPARERGGLFDVTLMAGAAALMSHFWHPKREVAVVHARFASPMEIAGRKAGGTTVAVSLHRWAMYGGGADLTGVTGSLSDWLLRSGERLGAETGYVTLDRVTAQSMESPWERLTTAGGIGRNVTSDLWGYGWGTLLSPAHLERIGGVAALATVHGGRVRELPGGRVWFTLGEDIANLDRATVAELREVLMPALPVGTMTLEEYYAQPVNEYGPVIEHYVL